METLACGCALAFVVVARKRGFGMGGNGERSG